MLTGGTPPVPFKSGGAKVSGMKSWVAQVIRCADGFLAICRSCGWVGEPHGFGTGGAASSRADALRHDRKHHLPVPAS